MSKLKILIHPTYFPNIATAAVWTQHDICWETWDNYQKQTFRNRSYICTDQGRQMLSIPVSHTGGDQGRQLYRDVRPDNLYPWQRQHWRGLQTAYRSSPFFEYFEQDLYPLFHHKYDFLLDFNFQCIEVICGCLGLAMPEVRTSDYQLEVVSMIDARFLVNAKLKNSITQVPYTQVFQDKHGFVPELSVLDLIFNEGNLALDYLKDIKLDFIHA